MIAISLAACLFSMLGTLHAADQPNILFIFADDLGWSDVGFNGSRYYETPRIDRLAAEGMRFANAYVAAPICSPSRATLMFGQNPNQSSAIQACVTMEAQSDLETSRIRELSKPPVNPFYRPFLGGSLDEVPARYALASPRHHLDAHDPPMMFMGGELDDPSTRADETRAQLTQLGIPTGLKVIPQAPHAFLAQQSWFDTAVATCGAFFGQHLKRSNKSPAPK
jgi:hypothetical protein